MKTITINQVSIPACWAICDDCEGEGHHSKHLGDFTATEFHETFEEPEDRADYFAGRYDRRCDTCKGNGKVLVPDASRLIFKHKRALVVARQEARADAEFAAINAAERRMGC